MAEAAGLSTGEAGVDTKSDDEHFVDKHQIELIKRVSNFQPILDELLHRNVIQQESYDQIKTLSTAEEKVRELISGPLKSSGVQGKDIFYEILIENEPLLIQDLKRMDAEVEKLSTKKRLHKTLNHLSSEELEKFKSIIDLMTGSQLFSVSQMTNTRDIVELMVETHSQECLKLTQNVLETMNRTDLVQRLIDTSPEKHRPSLMQRVETMESVIELLLKALKDLSKTELKEFKSTLRPVSSSGYSSVQSMQQKAKYIPLDLLVKAEMLGIVCLMVQYYGQQSVEMTKEILKMMEKTVLVQRLSDSSSRPKKKLSVDEHQSALIKKAATMGAVKELLLETLNDLSYDEQKTFTWFLQFTFFQKSLPQIDWSRMPEEDMTESLVDVIVEKYGQKSLEVTREVLMDINQTDLVQRLSEGLKAAAGSSAELFGMNTTEKENHSVEEDWPTLIQKVESIESVIELLLKTLKDLSVTQLKEFNDALLSQPEFQRRSLSEPLLLLPIAHAQDTVFVMVQICGKKYVEKSKDILKTMKRTDLVQRLSDRSSGSKKKHSTDEHRSALIHKVATIAAVQQLLLETLNDLSKKQLKKFEKILQSTVSQKNLRNISWMWSHGADRTHIVNEMIENYGQQSVELTREVFMVMKRTDLIQRLSKPSSGLKGPSRRLEHEDFGSAMQDSSDWNKLEPEVNSTDADEAPTYSLQSAAGNFECSVSGLRWVCKEKVSFKYQFCSWGEPTKRMEMISYMPAGPLMNIKVTAGKLHEAYLPHWICIDNNPEIRDKFAVLHINDCGDVVEKVAEVTSSHVKLSEPVFSLRAVLMKVGVPVKIYCNVLIYKTDKEVLTLDVYLIPRDRGLQQKLDNSYSKCQIIKKPHPGPPLRMNDFYILTAGLDGEEIDPEKLMLRYDENPSFFEVHIKKANTDFDLMLRRQNKHEPVRICTIRKGDYQSAADIQDAAPADQPSVLPPPTGLSAAERGEDEHFVDKHRLQLIEKVNNIAPILDELLHEKVIQQEQYNTIRALQTRREKMRELYSGPLQASRACKDIFYKILEEREPRLINGLKEKN